MNFARFRISVRPSKETNDHEVQLFGDDALLIPEDLMGMDPDDILYGPLRAMEEKHVVTYARCKCGVVGCDNAQAEIARCGDEVVWKHGDATHTFPAHIYDGEVERAMRDTSWEPPDRTAARLCREAVNRDALAESGMRFGWASGRIQDGFFTVSLSVEPGLQQRLVHLPWRDESPEQIAAAMCALLTQPPETWR